MVTSRIELRVAFCRSSSLTRRYPMARKAPIASVLATPVVAIQTALNPVRTESSNAADTRLACTINGASKSSEARNSSRAANVVEGVLRTDTGLNVTDAMVTAPSSV